MIEDHLFVPAVKLVEQQLAQSGTILYTDDTDSDPADSDRSDLLSDREKDILISITKGLSNKEIADTLCLSVHTVATHRRNISQKLQIHSTAGLIIYAIANKLVRIEDIQQGGWIICSAPTRGSRTSACRPGSCLCRTRASRRGAIRATR